MPLHESLDGYQALLKQAASALEQTLFKITGVRARSDTAIIDDPRRKYITLKITVSVKLPRPLLNKALEDSESK